MARAVTVWSVGIVLFFCAGVAFGQGPPPLEAPVIEPDVPKAAAAKPAKPADAPPPALPAGRPMLVVPGVTTPVPRAGNSSKPVISSPARAGAMTGGAPADPAPPPDAMKARTSPFRPPGGLTTQPSPDPALRAPIPLSIEPLDDESSPGVRPKRQATGRIKPDPSQGTGRPGVRDESSPPARPAPSRMPGLLGRFLGSPPPAPSRTPARNAGARNQAKDELPTEPLTDSEVKRTIERQIREIVGDRVRSVEVRVNGKNVLISAHATRFWQKRAVRRSLETLPVLAGYRAHVEIDD
jgi:hypothetical protein